VTAWRFEFYSYRINIGSGAGILLASAGPYYTTTSRTTTPTSPTLHPPLHFILSKDEPYELLVALHLASPSSAAAAGPNGVDFVKDTYIPIFSNRPGDYKEWRKRILMTKKKSDINKKTKEATINLMTSLSGFAWRQIEHPVDKASEAEDGFNLIGDAESL